MEDSNFVDRVNNYSLPYDPEAEKCVLGCILLDGECLNRVAEIITNPDYFYIENHKLIYAAMFELYTVGQPVDFMTVLNRMRQMKNFDEAVVKPYLLSLCELTPSTSRAEIYAEYVRDKFEIRQLITAAQSIIEDATAGKSIPAKILDSAEQRIYDIRQGREISGLKKIDSVIVEVLDRLDILNSEESENVKAISTGIADLDNYITGLNRSDLILLAARPGMGKTSFALNIAREAAVKSKKTVAFFTLEMSREQLASRLLSSEARIEGTKLRTGKLSPEEWTRLIEAGDILAKTNVYFDDTPGITIPAMKAKLRRLKNLDLVVIDYLQLMKGNIKTDNRVQEISEITRNLKIMAKEFNIPVITLSQLSRASEQRADHRPQLSDLRDSGSIEQDADIVLFLYREAYYDQTTGSDGKTDKNQGECIVAKNRHGEAGIVNLHWQGEYMRFTAMEVGRDPK